MTNDLFKRIGAAATRFGRSGYGLPAQKAIVETRKLVGFSLLGADYVLPLNEVNEILELPPCHRHARVDVWLARLAQFNDSTDRFCCVTAEPTLQRLRRQHSNFSAQ